ncbi:hypothetical protein MGALJ_20570 [Mycobacterium gallinarum]|uniref:Uncharacterized protein n=1 Tax=Mycobacterium gallinarum TaxID=39689 RepID=A0A9W4B9B4_9MYCO|nr:hypothetical protein MGALJ_20570 [Mycobacterium gallinarum]
MRHHRAGGIEHHSVSHRPLLTAEYRPHRLGVRLRVSADELGQLRAGEPERHRIERQPLDGAGLNAPDGARRGGGQLVKAVVAMHHQHAGAAGGEHSGHHLGQVRPRAADQTGPRRRRIRQRPKQIENSGHTDLTPHNPGMPVGRMELRRETESDTDLGDAAGDILGTQVDPHPERLQSVGTT